MAAFASRRTCSFSPSHVSVPRRGLVRNAGSGALGTELWERGPGTGFSPHPQPLGRFSWKPAEALSPPGLDVAAAGTAAARTPRPCRPGLWEGRTDAGRADTAQGGAGGRARRPPCSTWPPFLVWRERLSGTHLPLPGTQKGTPWRTLLSPAPVLQRVSRSHQYGRLSGGCPLLSLCPKTFRKSSFSGGRNACASAWGWSGGGWSWGRPGTSLLEGRGQQSHRALEAGALKSGAESRGERTVSSSFMSSVLTQSRARYAHEKVAPGPCLVFLTVTPGP